MKKYLEGLIFGVTGLLIGMSCLSVAWQFQPTAPTTPATLYSVVGNGAASGVIKNSEGIVAGAFCNSIGSTPLLVIYDNASSSVYPPVASFVPTAATYYTIPVHVNNGIYVTTTGTLSCTLTYQ